MIEEAPVATFGHCSKCPCPGFVGSGYTCERGGCGHHFDDHGYESGVEAGPHTLGSGEGL